jgi:hypothetical protein
MSPLYGYAMISDGSFIHFFGFMNHYSFGSGINQFCESNGPNWFLPNQCTCRSGWTKKSGYCYLDCPPDSTDVLRWDGGRECKQCHIQIDACTECETSITQEVTCSDCVNNLVVSADNLACECPPVHYQQGTGLDSLCVPNTPFCDTAENQTGRCLTCIPLYEVNPDTFGCQLIQCASNEWRRADQTCAPNPPNCVTATDTYGICSVASDGYYVKTDTSIELCSTIDANCDKCQNYDAKCTDCSTNYAWNEDLQKCVYDCPMGQATNPTNTGCYSCSSVDPNCATCSGTAIECVTCAVGFKLAGPAHPTLTCIPDCASNEYFDPAISTTTCQACPDNCLRCADITG